MNSNKARFVLAAAGLSLFLAASPTMADVANLPDADNDAYAVTSSSYSVGDHDIDLRNVTIDHGTESVLVTSLFDYTDADSWTYASVEFDLDGDNVADYTALWAKSSGTHGVVRDNPDGSYTATCTSANPAERLGVNGTVSLSFPRTCLGSPASFRVHVDFMWSGQNTSGQPLYFGDSAPGVITDDTVQYSQAVATSNTGTVTSPAPPVVTSAPPIQTLPALKAGTSVKASLSSRTQVVGRQPASVKVRVSGTGSPSGIVKVVSGSKKIRTFVARTGRSYTVKLPSSLKVGANRIKVSFAPADPSLYEGSSKTVTLQVRR